MYDDGEEEDLDLSSEQYKLLPARGAAVDKRRRAAKVVAAVPQGLEDSDVDMSGSSDGGGGASDDDFDGGGGGDASSESAAESLDEGASDAEAAAAPASDDDAAAPAKKRQRTAGKGKARAEASPSENAGGSNGQDVGRVPPTCAPAPRPGELRSRLIGGSGSPDDAQGVTLPVSADAACSLNEHARLFKSAIARRQFHCSSIRHMQLP